MYKMIYMFIFQSTEVFHHGHHTAHAPNLVVVELRQKLELAQILLPKMGDVAVQAHLEKVHHATQIDAQVKSVSLRTAYNEFYLR